MMRPDNPNAGRARMAMHQIRELRRINRLADARRVALNVIDFWHLATPLIRVIPTLSWPDEQRDRVIERLVEIGRTANGQMREECVVGLIVVGAGEAASALLEELANQPGKSDSTVLRGIIASFRSPTTRPTPSFEDNVITRAAKPGAQRCLVVFYGAMDGLGIPLPLFDCLMAPLDVSIIYVRDKHRMLYLNGIDGLGGSMAASVESLRAMISELGATDIYTLGTSSGGIGAIRYGLGLGARGIMAMGTPTNLQTHFMSKDGRFAEVHNRLNELLPAYELDMRNFVANTSTPQRIFLYHGDGHTYDRIHAEQLAGLPGVEIRPVDNFEGHSVLRPMLERGEMIPAMTELMEMRP